MGRGNQFRKFLDSKEVIFKQVLPGSESEPLVDHGVFSYLSPGRLLDKTTKLNLLKTIKIEDSTIGNQKSSLAFQSIAEIKTAVSFIDDSDIFSKINKTSGMENVFLQNFTYEQVKKLNQLTSYFSEKEQEKLIALLRYLIILKEQNLAEGDLFELIQKEQEVVSLNPGSFIEQNSKGKRLFELKNLFSTKEALALRNKQLPSELITKYENLKKYIIEDFYLSEGTAQDFLGELVSYTDGCYSNHQKAFQANKELEQEFKSLSRNCWLYSAHALAHMTQRNHIKKNNFILNQEKDNLIQLIYSLISLKIFVENEV